MARNVAQSSSLPEKKIKESNMIYERCKVASVASIDDKIKETHEAQEDSMQNYTHDRPEIDGKTFSDCSFHLII